MSPSFDINGTAPKSTDVETKLFFTAPKTKDGKKPYTNVNAINGVRPSNIEIEEKTVTIHDIRGHEQESDLDVTGFQIRTEPSAFTNFDSEEEVKSTYYDEVTELIKRTTGASRVFIFDHTMRKLGSDDSTPNRRAPVQRAHVDQTPKAALARVFRHMGDDAEELSKKRFQIINVWRAIEHPAYNYPLAFADFRSIADEDLVATSLIYPHMEGETYSVRYNPNQRWYYLKDMTPSEVAFIKCYDSKDGVAHVTPHTAFDNDHKDLPGRQSIEVRTIVFY